ncbi:hypothetical protein GE09DRAFT_357330 [Coniochaeta sp. 2T2.1]|nr:hypothetical protein GE09DRAFT_357330 [Coniochaeta sp. 2T2.1]
MTWSECISTMSRQYKPATMNLRTPSMLGKNLKWSDLDASHWYLVQDCKSLLRRLEHQRTRTELFRNGLLNASSVFDSRISSRLSENVMLLTYVSILFIPLASTSSLWSVPNIQLPTNQLATAMVTVALATYAVTFNINTMSRVWLKFYHKRRNIIIKYMKDGGMPHDEPEVKGGYFPWWTEYDILHEESLDDLPPSPPPTTIKGRLTAWIGGKWKERAERYERTFRLSREKSEPSEWFIVVVLLYYLVMNLWSWAAAHFRRRESRPDHMDHAEKGKATKRIRQTTWWRKSQSIIGSRKWWTRHTEEVKR